MKKVHTQKYLRKRKFMLILPLLTIPFITLAFWAVRLGDKNNNDKAVKPKEGLNLTLPEPKLILKENENKLSFYDKAKEDSIKLQLEKKNDPYYRNRLDTLQSSITAAATTSKYGHIMQYNDPLVNPSSLDSNEAKIYERLDALKKIIEQPQPKKPKPVTAEELATNKEMHSEISHDVDRLEALMNDMSSKDSVDPEMKQINEVLDKILALQKSEPVKSLPDSGETNKGSAASFEKSDPATSDETYFGDSIQTDSLYDETSNQFFDESADLPVSSSSNTIHASIYSTQTVTQGSTIKLRTLQDAYIRGAVVPEGSFMYGVTSINNERLLIDIPSIRIGEKIIELSLTAYDLDGLRGIYIPGSISRDVAKQSAEQSLQSIELLSLDPSIKGQAASAGLQAAKNLLSKKVRAIKVTVRAGYEVLLKEGPAN
jgi:conjugative transposon TraM protein